MTATRLAVATEGRRAVLSSLWIFLMFNYIYVDFLSVVLNPSGMTQVATRMPDAMMLGWIIVLEIPMAMIVLSRVARCRTARWANILAGILETAAAASTLFLGASRLYFVLPVALEIACTTFIVWYAWTWRLQASAAAAG